MELKSKQGFKHSDFGLIPEDWNSKSISEISNPVRGGSPRPAGSPKYFNGDFIPWLTVASLTNIPNSQIFVTETKSFLTEAGSHLSRKLEKGTLIIANSGATLGVAKLLGIKCCANDGVAALQEIDKNVYPNYLVYYINTITKRLREDIATGNGQPNLNTELIGNIQIPIPPTLTEQKSIATALGDLDELISGLEKLISKKKDIKQGVMQQLLTPKDDWEIYKVDEISIVGRGRVISHKEINLSKNKTYPVYSSQTANNGVMGFIDTYDFDGEYVTWTTDGENAGTVFHRNGKFNCTNVCGTIKLKKGFDGKFISYALSRTTHKHVSRNLANPKLMNGPMKKITIFIPDLNQQKNIANIISDLGEEISQLETKKEKYQDIKQGMMQELLTGKTRLI